MVVSVTLGFMLFVFIRQNVENKIQGHKHYHVNTNLSYP